MDNVDAETRSRIMSRIRSTETGPERAFRSELRKLGLVGYRKNWGKPNLDVAFVGRRVGVFIDGCFWHRCPMHFKAPKTRSEWWSDKINAAWNRDRRADDHYAEVGWTIFRFWEHESVVDAARRVAMAMA